MTPPNLNLFNLSGRTALITGASSGIGFALAGGLARAGARVVLNARGPEKLAQAADSLRAQGADVHTAAFDVTQSTAVAEGIARVEAELGPSTSWSTTPACSVARRWSSSRRINGTS